jgi:glycerol kinase
MQEQANLLDKPVILPEVMEITALGAAYLAGLAVGYWEGQRDIVLNWRTRRRFEPNLGDQDRIRRIERWHRAIKTARTFEDA